jgi:isocitrate dehydrogenase kinase/phosphatase
MKTTAEEKLKEISIDNRIYFTSNEWESILKAMQEFAESYHDEKVAEVTESVISEQASIQVSRYLKAMNNPTHDLHKRFCFMAKWMRNRLIGKP